MDEQPRRLNNVASTRDVSIGKRSVLIAVIQSQSNAYFDVGKFST